MLLVSLALLMLAGVIRPWWMLLAMAIMTFAYLAANFNFIQHHYGVFTSVDPFNNARVSDVHSDAVRRASSSTLTASCS